MASRSPGSRFWEFLCHHQSHVEWVGCSLHDLIQPSFSFLVGVALPFSLAGRLARGQSKVWMTAHALWRSLILVFLGVFLRSRGSSQTNFTFEDTLSQIGLGYTFLFLLAFFSRARAVGRAGVDPRRLLGGIRPLSAPGRRVRLCRGWRPTGLALSSERLRGALGQEQQPGLGVRHLVPEPVPPQAAVHAQRRRLRDVELHPDAGDDDPGPAGRRGLAAHRAGLGQGRLALRRGRASAWRPAGAWASWASARWSSGSGPRAGCSISGGWCFLFLAGFYAVLDLLGVAFWAFPLRVIGMNSIAAYCMAGLFEGFIAKNLTTHLGKDAFAVLGKPYEPLLHGAAVLLVLWLILFWMYRRKIFLRI